MKYAVCLLMLLCVPVHAGQPCHAQQVQVQTVQQVAIPVAAVPLTLGYAVDLQSYQYRVNPDAFSFNTYSGYLNNSYNASQHAPKTAPRQQTSAPQGAIQLDDATKHEIALELLRLLKEQGVVQITEDPEPAYTAPKSPAPAGDTGEMSPEALGAMKTVLVKNCARCHTLEADPKGSLAMFDTRGNLLSGLPRDKILSRINTDDPEVRMPPPPAKALDTDAVAVIKAWAQTPPRK